MFSRRVILTVNCVVLSCGILSHRPFKTVFNSPEDFHSHLLFTILHRSQKCPIRLMSDMFVHETCDTGSTSRRVVVRTRVLSTATRYFQSGPSHKLRHWQCHPEVRIPAGVVTGWLFICTGLFCDISILVYFSCSPYLPADGSICSLSD